MKIIFSMLNVRDMKLLTSNVRFCSWPI